MAALALVEAKGDTYVDAHHTVEGYWIGVRSSFGESPPGDKAGIERYGDAWVPMDEALTQVVIDLVAVHTSCSQGEWSTPVLGGNFETELVEDFFQALAMSGAMNLHVRNL